MKGLICHVYRSSIQATNGPSAYADTILLVGREVAEVFEETEDRPTFLLKHKMLAGVLYLYAVPFTRQVGTMAGGNFCYTSDGRFPNRYPISLHDRTE